MCRSDIAVINLKGLGMMLLYTTMARMHRSFLFSLEGAGANMKIPTLGAGMG